MDRSFSLYGVHIGIKYRDPADLAKGGKLRVAVDDLPAIFRRARSKNIEILVKFDGGDSKTDGLFDLDIHYTLNHADGTGEEKGTLKMFCHKERNYWVSHLKTVADVPYNVRSIIPSMINNAQIDVVSDRETKFNLKYTNKYKRGDIEINVDRIPGREAHLAVVTYDGTKIMDLTFTATGFNLSGTVFGEQISVSVDGARTSTGYRIRIHPENQEILQVDVNVESDPSNMRYSTKMDYAVIGENYFRGRVDMKYENKEFTVKHLNKETNNSWEPLRGNWTLINDASTFDLNLEIQDMFNLFGILFRITDYIFRTNMVEWYRDLYQGFSGVRIFVDKQNRNFLLPKFLIDVKLPSLVPCDGTEETPCSTRPTVCIVSRVLLSN